MPKTLTTYCSKSRQNNPLH